MKKAIFVRLGVSDLVLSQEDAEKITGHLNAIDKDGEYVTDTETYFIGYEDEEGNECDEEGNLL